MSCRRDDATAPAGAVAPPEGTVYLLHFDEPYRHARHYIGWTQNLARRVADHRKGYAGARLLEVVVKAGITFRVARVWVGVTRAVERCKKNQGGASRLCPICKAEAAARRAEERGSPAPPLAQLDLAPVTQHSHRIAA